MTRMKYKKMVKAAAVGLAMATVFSTTNAMAASVKRVEGHDRFNTARNVAEDIFNDSENVILVNGEGYADAVSATPLAKKLNAPILLTKKDALPDGVLDTIKTIGASNVYIVGGDGVVSPVIEATLKTNGLNVTRYAKAGGSRYDTNAMVARELISRTGAKKAILVNGRDGYSDALSVASIAAKLEIPVLISNSISLDPGVKKVIDEYKLEVMAVGGSSVLPDTIVKSANGTRVAQGKDRFKTNMAVLNYFKPNYSFDKVYVASGGNDSVKNFADALVASAAAAKSGSPVVLSGNAASAKDLASAEKFIKDNINEDSVITLVGGVGVLSQDVENSLNKIVGGTSEQDLEIIAIY